MTPACLSLYLKGKYVFFLGYEGWNSNGCCCELLRREGEISINDFRYFGERALPRKIVMIWFFPKRYFIRLAARRPEPRQNSQLEL